MTTVVRQSSSSMEKAPACIHHHRAANSMTEIGTMQSLQSVDVLRAHLPEVPSTCDPATIKALRHAFILKVKPGSTAATAASFSSCTPKPPKNLGKSLSFRRCDTPKPALNKGRSPIRIPTGICAMAGGFGGFGILLCSQVPVCLCTLQCALVALLSCWRLACSDSQLSSSRTGLSTSEIGSESGKPFHPELWT